MPVSIPKECENCGEPFIAQRSVARFCSARCRLAHHRAPQPRLRVVDEPPKPRGRPAPPRKMSDVARYTREELRKARRLGTAHGQIALLLASRIDHASSEPGAAVAALSREWANAYERAMREAEVPDEVTRIQKQGDAEAAARAAR